ncbi:hypothetical protein [Salipiger mucosus]|uniref:Uncharacterized protein n=1 Tax=Salipiger mucosus DSM 16094 TaxID=1123237 RepID=S9Q9L6_9RHOB|nr:hypothetical protein [Salipiger mucosus]EPX78051.1 hypothetical protein Salmuc_03373 [Salipiger mucosus DSM 16094]
MLFHGAIIGAYSTDEEGLLIDTRLGQKVLSGEATEKALTEAPRSYLQCDFAPELVEGCEDLFDIYSPVVAEKLAVPKVKFIGQMTISFPVIDVGVAFNLPAATGITNDDVIQWEDDTGRKIVDAVTLHWIADERYNACPLDRSKSRVLKPR